MSGSLKQDSVESIFAELNRLCEDHRLRVDMASRMQELIDGRGAERIVECFQAF